MPLPRTRNTQALTPALPFGKWLAVSFAQFATLRFAPPQIFAQLGRQTFFLGLLRCKLFFTMLRHWESLAAEAVKSQA